MENVVNKIKSAYKRNKSIIWFVSACVFIFGFIAHGFMFSNVAYSHDSLNEFNASVYGNEFRIQFGKFLVPAYRYLTRGVIAIPWIIGILSLIYISISAILVVKMFDIKSKSLMVLISGIFTTNMAVIATTASFIHDLDCDMLALMLATFGAYLWNKSDKGFLWGTIPCAMSLAFYQSYIAVPITLIIIYSILSLLKNVDYHKVLRKGFKGMGMLLGSGILYGIALKIALLIANTHIMSGRGSSLDIMVGKSFSEVIHSIFRTYAMTPYKLLFTEFIYPKWFVIATCLLLVAIAGIMILCMFKSIKLQARLLTIFLILIMPFGMNFAGLLAFGNSHDLMLFAIWLTYAFCIFVVYLYASKKPESKKKEVLKGISIIIVSLFIITNILTANTLYLKKKMDYDATLSYMTRVTDSVERFDGYEKGETELVFVGTPSDIKTPVGLDKYNHIMGNSSSYALWMSNSRRCQAYYDYVLMNGATFADEDTFYSFNKNDEVLNMPEYPNEGSIKFIDGYLVVKLGESYLAK